MLNLAARAYVRVLRYPRTILSVLLVVTGVAGFFATQFSFDASSDTLVVEGDRDLANYQRVAKRFGGDKFLLLTFAPHQGRALDAVNVGHLESLTAEIAAIPGVRAVFSILDAPLIKSPPIPLAELDGGFRNLRSEDVDWDLAQAELTSSPLFSELLISRDGRATAMRIDLAPDDELDEVVAERDLLQAKKPLSQEQSTRLSELLEQHLTLREAFLERRDDLISAVRDVRVSYADRGVLHLGGVPMIAADMIAYAKGDLVVFGGGVLMIVMVVLFAFFRRVRWVLLPIATSALAIVLTIGVLGFVQRPATVISSNFVSLLAITTISLIIHLIVRYRELLHLDTTIPIGALVSETMLSKFAPCLYTALTTMAAFGSLTVSRIVPVEDFGWMMCLGIAIAFTVTFTFFPAVLLLLGRASPRGPLIQELAVTRVMGEFSRWRYKSILGLVAVWSVVVVFGITKVNMDNRFIDYFHSDTDINQGMRYIDQHLGGTMPFDVILRFAPFEEFDDSELEDDFFADEATEEAYPERYWFTRDKLDRIEALHSYLEARPEIGKVMSLASLERLAREFTDGEPLTGLQIAGVLAMLPEELRDELIHPYASPAYGEVRLNARVIESGPSFDRNALVADIVEFVQTDLDMSVEDVQVTGMMVLFNSMLLQLVDSQLDSLAYVLLAAFLMLLVLLRSLLYALIGLIPNILAAATVIAFMGYAGIPLDMMTTTIAAVSVGIGVDNAIHYLHRFQQEYDDEKDVRLAVAWSHATIGRAMYFTSVTVIVGFSVLGFSNFVPTIMFGLLVAIAMALSFVANLTLLPALLVLILGTPRRPANIPAPP